nr:MAG TPA: hypothetical protein [Caudoviricetes sp.]
MKNDECFVYLEPCKCHANRRNGRCKSCFS